MGSSVSGAINSYAGIEKYSPDFQLLGQVMNSKQTQLNSNRSKLQDYRNQLGTLDVAKEEDRAYLDQRLDQVTDITNKYANLELSSDALTNSLIGNMGQVFDQNVTAALTGTKILRNEQAEWAKAREKGDGKYSDANYAYAMRQANQWLNDGATGTRYNGGGGFIEYASPTEHINKMMPELLKAATHKRQRPIAGPAGGIGGIITEEYVDRNELQSMIQSQLGEKHLRQMQIDAWANYDQLPDNILEQEYNNFTEPKIQENADKITSLEAAIANATNPDLKKQYQDSLDYAKKEKDSFENENSFSSLMSSRGKRDVYTTLHQAKVFDGFLDAYSREPLVVDIEVNAIDSANRELEMKREALAETKSQNKIANELKQEANDIAAFKAGLKDQNGQDIDPTKNLGTLPGRKLVVEPKHETNSTYSRLHDDLEATEDKLLTSLLKMKVPERDANAFLKSKRYAKMTADGDVAGLTTLMVNGKVYTVNSDFRSGILDMNVNHMNSPVLGKAFTEIDEMVNTAQKAIGKGLRINELERNDIPEFNIALKPKPGKPGEYTILPADSKAGFVNVKTGGSYNTYMGLLKKQAGLKKGESLSDTEKANLQLYGNLHLLNDGGISDEQAAFVKQRIVKQLNALGLDSKDFVKVNLDRKVKKGDIIPNTRTKVVNGPETWMTEITRKDVTTNDGTKSADNAAKMYANAIQGLKDIDKVSLGPFKTKEEYKKELEYAVKFYGDQVKVNPVDVEDHITSRFKLIENMIEDNQVEQTKLISGREIILPKNAATKTTWERLAASVGLSIDAKDNLVLTPRIYEGQPTGEVYITKRGVKLDTKTAIKEKMTTQELELLRTLKIDLTKHKYNATKGEFAPTLRLGTGIYQNGMAKGLTGVQKKNMLGLAEENPNIADKINTVLEEYAKGNYTINIEPISGTYYTRVLNKQGQDVIPGYYEEVGSLIEDSQVDTYLENPKFATDAIIANMLTKFATANE